MGLRDTYLVFTPVNFALSTDDDVVPILVGFMAVPCRGEISNSFRFAIHFQSDRFLVRARGTWTVVYLALLLRFRDLMHPLRRIVAIG